ncbi:MAG: GTPase HflX [Halolamina sp.]
MQDSPTRDETDASSGINRPESTQGADETAIVVARAADQQPATAEIRRLADAAGYTVVDELTQRRCEDSSYNIGHGKAKALARRVVATEAAAVLFDTELTPGQYRNLVGLLPDGTVVIDRHRLVLDIFEQGTGGKAAQLQVELAKLRYELPRVRETEERTHMQEAAETGSRLVDIEKRIRTVERKLERVTDRAAERRTARRAEGFGLVAIAGYTNAGKSTLLHRLADDLAIEDLDARHADLDGAAEVEDRLFKTLETTTRRATLGGRPVLLTDTVGLVDGLPHELVASFSATLDAVADSDAGLLVVDASDPLERLQEKLRISLAALDEPRGELVAVLNKTDLMSEDELAARREIVAERDDVDAVVAVSATVGTGTEPLRSVVSDALPSRTEEFVLPNDGETQSFLAWAHDRGRVETVYDGDEVQVRFEASPAVVARAVTRAVTGREER